MTDILPVALIRLPMWVALTAIEQIIVVDVVALAVSWFWMLGVLLQICFVRLEIELILCMESN